jgi:hypothetical protein
VSIAGPEIPQIASDIMAGGPKPEKQPADRVLSLQVFLRLAEEFDRQSLEAKEKLDAIDRQYLALQRSFQGDEDGAEGTTPSMGLNHLTVMEEDLGGVMINGRMLAWNRLFQEDPVDAGLLLTNSPSAIAFLLEGVETMKELFRLTLPCCQVGPEEALQEELPWVSRLEETIRTVVETPWREALQKEVMTVGREMGVETDEWRTTEKADEVCVVSTWFVVPRQTPQGLFNHCCAMKSTDSQGAEKGKIENTLVVSIKACG